jgi:hypothetical protein
MEPKQFNVRMPLFAHGEFAELRTALRELGSKPTDGDLVAALIHAALAAVEETKSQVEAFVIHELAQEREAPP